MGLMSEIDIEIKNSQALSYLWHEITVLNNQLDNLGTCVAHIERCIKKLEEK